MTKQLNNKDLSDEPLAIERGFFDKNGNPDYMLSTSELDFVLECYPDMNLSNSCEIIINVNRTTLAALWEGMTHLPCDENHLFKLVNHGVAILLDDANIKDLRNDAKILDYAIHKYGTKRGGYTLDEWNEKCQLDWPSDSLLGDTIYCSPEAKQHLEDLAELLDINPSELCLIAIWHSLMNRSLYHQRPTATAAHGLTMFWWHIRWRHMMVHHDLRSYPNVDTEYWQEQFTNTVERTQENMGESPKKGGKHGNKNK